jgi:peptidoglycan hydrolase-like protein with peptidoglycan-binding domain
MTSSLTPSAINSSGGFSWTPKNQDVGGHNITVMASDYLGDSANSTVNINVSVATSTIQSLSPGATVFSGQNVTFTVVPTGFTNPTYAVSDSFYGGSVSNSNINYNGNFSWTPNQSDIGTHNISITVNDSTGNSSTISQQITVSGTGLSIGSISPGTSITPGTTFAFIATTSGFTSQSYYSVSDLFSGTSISNNNITSGGVFSWTPLLSDVGVHTITVSTLDNFGRSVRGSLTVTVNPNSTSATAVQNVTTTSASGRQTFLNNLNIGSTGADVTALQTILNQKGFFQGPISGYFGALTAAAVKKFQTANGVSPLGNVGPATRAALNDLQNSSASSTSAGTAGTTSTKYTFTSSLSVGSTGADVTALQNRLTSEGVYSGPITGTFGPLTRAAVEKYQTAHGISPIGQVGPATRAALNQ